MAFLELHRKKWEPVKLGPADTTILSIALLAAAIVRALDYSTGSDAIGAPGLAGIEEAFPLWAWSAALLGGCAVLASGMIARRHLQVFLGHSLFAVIYTGLFVGGSADHFSIDRLDGIRSAVSLAVPATYSTIVAIRMGVKPVDCWRS